MAQSGEVIYIMGRGHSGSTILAGLLGHSARVVNVGELSYPMRSLCGCGQSFARCEFWQKVRADYEHRSGIEWESSLRLLQDQAHFLKFLTTWFAPSRSRAVQRLARIDARVVRSVLHVSGRATVLDASKQPARALLLMRQAPGTKFVHVVRHPDGYLRSYVSRLADGKVNFLRREVRAGSLDFIVLILVAFSWVVANVQCELVRLRAPSRVLRVRFEDLTENPIEELRRLATFLGVDLEPVVAAVAAGQRMNVGHIIGGNDHMRSSNGFRLERRARAHHSLPWFYRAVVRLVSWPLMLLYGYPLTGAATRVMRPGPEERISEEQVT